MNRSLTVLAAAAALAWSQSIAGAQAGPNNNAAAPAAPAPQAPAAAPQAPAPPPAPMAQAPAPPPAPTAPAPAAPPAPMAQTPAPAAPPATVTIDPAVTAALDSVETKLQSLTSIAAVSTSATTITMAGIPAGAGNQHAIAEIKLMRPNFARITMWQQKLSPADKQWHRADETMVMAADGKNNWFWMATNNQYRKTALDPKGGNIMLGMAEGLDGFFDPSTSLSSELKQYNNLHYLRSDELKTNQTWNGASYTVVEFAFDVPMPAAAGGATMHLTQDVYIGSDSLVHRITISSSIVNEDVVFDPIKPDLVIDKTVFAFVPPAGSSPISAAAAPAEPSLLKDGTTAPDFTVKDPKGNAVKLSSYRGKVVVVDFWATWCGPCQESLPHTNEVAEKFKGKDVVFLAVNSWDTMDAFKAWLPQHKDFDALNFAIDTQSSPNDIASSLYKVSGIPTQYIIDKTGKITNSFVGYEGPTDDLENAVIKAGG